jgi:RimJ/RimL family protein N-acetyltransferase
MLKKVIYVFHDQFPDELKEMDDERKYLLANGLQSSIICGQRPKDILALCRGSVQSPGDASGSLHDILFLCDSADDLSAFKAEGAFVSGMITPQSPDNISFPGVRYIFSEIDDTDSNSLIKALQREAGLPWDILTTDRLMVRETTTDDIDQLYRIYSEPSMTRYMEGLFEKREDEMRYTNDYIEKVYHLTGFGIWSLILISTGELIGRAGFSIRNGFDEPELGFFIGVPWQKQGYAREACSAILDYGRNTLNFTRVQALVKEGNDISIHLCKSLGFNITGTVEVEEEIYGNNYMTNGHLSIGPEKKGSYIRLKKDL